MSYSVEQRGRTCSLAEEVSPLDLARNMPGFSAQIPVDICNREFPYHKVISRKLHIGNAPSFSVFAFTTKEFDPSKESLLIIDGGPGGIWNATDAKDVAKMFLAYNTVFFHYRGGGCSALPDSTKELDKTISSINTVADIEGIRSAYQIKRWKSVIGFSYGTNVARMYAHFKPNQMESIVLEGLDQPGRREKARDQSAASSVVQSTNIIDIIKSRYQDSAYLKATISPANFKLFIETTLPQYLAQAPASLNYSLLGFWDTYQKFYVDYYQKQQQPFPRYLNRNTFAMIVALAYASADARSDGAIVFLISQFIDVDIDTVIKTQMNAYVKTLTYTLYPFLDPDYLEIFKTGSLISKRVELAMPANDTLGSMQNLCTGVRTLVLNGTVDSATPVAQVRTYLGNKSCSSNADNLALIIQGGGHANMNKMTCLSEFATAFMSGAEGTKSLTQCALPVSVERF